MTDHVPEKDIKETKYSLKSRFLITSKGHLVQIKSKEAYYRE